MINSYNDRSYCLLNNGREDHFGATGDGEGGVGPSTTHLFSQKYNVGRDRKDGGVQTSKHERTAYPMELFSSIYYPVGNYYGYSFGFAAGDGKYGMGPRTTHISSHKYYCWIDGGGSVSSKSIYYSEMVHFNKYKLYNPLSQR